MKTVLHTRFMINGYVTEWKDIVDHGIYNDKLVEGRLKRGKPILME